MEAVALLKCSPLEAIFICFRFIFSRSGVNRKTKRKESFEFSPRKHPVKEPEVEVLLLPPEAQAEVPPVRRRLSS